MIFALQLELTDERQLVFPQQQVEVVGIVGGKIELGFARCIVDVHAAFCCRSEAPARGLKGEARAHLEAEHLVFSVDQISAVSASGNDILRLPIELLTELDEAQSDEILVL